MENLKKNPLSLQLNVEDFAPASNEEKKSLVIMRESVNFWKDGMRRLRKNKIAMVSLVVILLIAFMAYVLPSLWPYSYELQIKGSKKRDSILGGILFVLFFALVIFMATLKETQDTGAVISLSVLEVLKLTLMGCIASATMVIPGVSGSMMLMLMGYYYPVIGAIKNLINALVALDGGAILYNVGILLPFGIGVVIGIFAIAKLIEILLAKWKCITYGAILGLVVASPFAILMGLSLPGFNLVQVIVSVLTFILGFAAAWLLARKDEKPAA